VLIADRTNFPATTIAAALVDSSRRPARAALAPERGRIAVLRLRPRADGRFAAAGRARTFDVAAGDVGYVPFAMGHYVENTAVEPLRFLEVFGSEGFAEVSLSQWLALTPPALVREHPHVATTRCAR
jgi:oxalate decarboxylase